jgi:hypothetical protein
MSARILDFKAGEIVCVHTLQQPWCTYVLHVATEVIYAVNLDIIDAYREPVEGLLNDTALISPVWNSSAQNTYSSQLCGPASLP